MFGLDGSNDHSNYRCDLIYYGLLNKKVYDVRVSGDLLEIGHCFRELACIYEPKNIIKIRKSRFCYSYLFFRDIEKREIL